VVHSLVNKKREQGENGTKQGIQKFARKERPQEFKGGRV
jgi:hypothetical protein